MRSGGDWTVGLVLAALAVALAVDRGFGAHVAVGLGLTACLLVIARVQGLTAANLGLARSTWPAGLRWGTAAATLVGAAYALAYLIAPVRQALPESDGEIGRAALWAVLVVIPLGTVVPEELAFRGLVLALLGRRYGVLSGTLLSSGLFGLWHIGASLDGDAGHRHGGLHDARRGRAVLAAAAQQQPPRSRPGPLDGQRARCHRDLGCLATTG
jgi:membrane protease YdiL (CAAX protease family)